MPLLKCMYLSNSKYLYFILFYFLFEPLIVFAGCVGDDEVCERGVWRNSFLYIFFESYLFWIIIIFLLIVFSVYYFLNK